MELVQQKSAQMTIERGKYNEFAANLKMRGFEELDRKEGKRSPMVSLESHRILQKRFGGFVVTCGSDINMGSFARELSLGKAKPLDLPLEAWTKFETEGGGGLRLLTHLFSKKIHYNSAQHDGKWPVTYIADMVPFDDAGVIIGNCLKLNDALARIRADLEFVKGLDAKEVMETLGAAIKNMNDGNSLKKEVGLGMDNYLLGFWNKYTFELERMKLDGNLVGSMEFIADRE